MRLQNQNPERIKSSADKFWRWFVTIAPILASDLEDPDLVADLDSHILAMNDELAWEVGPGRVKDCQLVISPNLNAGLLPVTRAIVDQAPEVPGWEFHPVRQPKEWDFILVIDASGERPVEIDASGWQFVLLQYPDGASEVLLQGDHLPELTSEQKRLAATIVLESELGEEVVLSTGFDFDLVDAFEPHFAAKARTIRQLRSAFPRSSHSSTSK